MKLRIEQVGKGTNLIFTAHLERTLGDLIYGDRTSLGKSSWEGGKRSISLTPTYIEA